MLTRRKKKGKPLKISDRHQVVRSVLREVRTLHAYPTRQPPTNLQKQERHDKRNNPWEPWIKVDYTVEMVCLFSDER